MVRTALAACFVTTLVAASPATALSFGSKHCGTGARWRSAIAKPRLRFDQQPGGDKRLRNPFGDPAFVKTSEHFAFWAGDCRGFDDKLRYYRCPPPDAVGVDRALAALEAAYAFEVTTLGYPPPDESNYINVYLGNSGQGVPEIDGDALAYTYLDDFGEPFIVLDPGVFLFYVLDDPDYPHLDELVDVTLAHEFFHVLQYTAESLEDYDSFWYWEATATWMESEIYPDSSMTNGYMPSYLATPLRSLAYFPWDDTDELSQSRPYGASIFVTYLSDNVGGRDLIKYTFLDSDRRENVFEVLERHLPELGTSLGAVVSDFAAHNAVLDYKRREQLFAELDLWGFDQKLGSVPMEPGNAYAYARTTAPQNLGYRVHALPALSRDYELVFKPIAAGSMGTPSRFGVEIARRGPSGVTYTRVPSDSGRARVAKTAAGESVFVTVAAIPEGSLDYEETFAYSLRLDEAGGGCRTTPQGQGSSAAGSGTLAVAAVLVIRRRRRSPSV